MQYKKLRNTGENVSVLGYGIMRMPTCEQNGKSVIDEAEAIRLIRYGIDNGINYIDTAFFYHDGESEVVVGKALADGYRDKVKVATKSPCGGFKTPEEFDNVLNEQLRRINTDHIDFYLLHAIDRKTWRNIVLPFGLLDKLKAAKESGKIRHIGFSFHDDLDAFREIIDGSDLWEFCQIQFNYADINHQAGIEGLKYAYSKGLDVIIMEPLRGGKLANVTPNVKAALSDLKSPVEWGLDFLWDKEEVGLLLSGMSNIEQLKDNLEYADKAQVGMLNDEQREMLKKAGDVFNNSALVLCTRCNYCSICPQGISIPDFMNIYNLTATAWDIHVKEMYDKQEVKSASCIACKKCESMCPQKLPISEIMPKVTEFVKNVK